MKNLFVRTFVVALGIIAAGAVVAWTGPTGTAPNNNVSGPLNVTATTQTKSGILSSSNSFVAPNVTANQFCIGTSCVTSWGQAGGSATWANITGKPYAFNQSADIGAGPSFGNVVLTNTSPTIYLADTDNRSAMIHNNSNLLYVLRGCGNGSQSWCAYNGVWPLVINLENNDIAVGGNLTAASFLYSSDKRLKSNITPIKDALAKIVELSGVNFRWKSGARAGQADVGVIAQDVQNVLPEAVHTDASGYLSVDYPKLVPLLIEAIKEQQTQIDTLKAEVDALRAGR